MADMGHNSPCGSARTATSCEGPSANRRRGAAEGEQGAAARISRVRPSPERKRAPAAPYLVAQNH
eukprot:scaffold31563_cov27-Tisochrysis_lutea.AAC.5